LIAGIEPEPDHFAINEINVIQCCHAQISQGEITVFKLTVDKLTFSQTGTGKITAGETAVFICSIIERSCCKINFIK
jgi:hypothetical protein